MVTRVTCELILKSFMDLLYLMPASSRPWVPQPPVGRDHALESDPWSVPYSSLGRDPYKLEETNKEIWSSKRFVCKQQIVKNRLSVYVPQSLQT